MISLLCSNYNSSKWIKNYLNYVNNQFLHEFEIVFVDADSTDDSLKVIESFNFRKGIEKKVLKYKERIGVYQAWNAAIEISSHDYVMNYNTDDRLFPSALLVMQCYTKTRPRIDVFYTNCPVCLDVQHTNIVGVHNWKDANDRNALLQGCCLGPFPLVRKQAIIDAGLFNPDYTICGDYEMWLRLNSKGYRFLKVPDMIGSYYQNPQGISTRWKTDPTTHDDKLREDREIIRMYS